jgi:predicted permease
VQHARRNGAAAWDFAELKKEQRLIVELGLYQSAIALVGGADSQSATMKFNAVRCEWNLFDFSRSKAMLGRGLLPDDHNTGAEPAVVLGYDAWQQLFQGEKSAIGQSVKVDTVSHKVVGVMPQGFAFPDVAQIWLPLPQAAVRPTSRTQDLVFAYARLQQGVSLSQVNQFLDAMVPAVKAELPEALWWLIPANQNKYLQAIPFKQANSDVRHYFGVFMSMLIVVLLILLLACINIGNLLLSRVNERWKEVAVRIALGAPSRRLVMQMLWESVLICLLGAVLALLLALFALEQANQALSAMFAVNQLQPFWWQLEIDGPALLILAASMLLMITVTGFIPAWRALHGDFNAVLRDGTRGAQSKKATHASRALVVSEILLSCVVLIMAFILLSTSYLAGQADYGVQVDNRLTAQLELPDELYPLRDDPVLRPGDLQKRAGFYARLKERLEQLPDINAAILMTELPGRGEGRSYFEIEGRAAAVYEENPYTNNEAVSRDSWGALGMRVLQGRDFNVSDVQAKTESILVNEHIARDFFKDGNAVGSRVRRIALNGSAAPWQTIVGVVSNTHHGSAMNTTSAQYNSYQMMERRSPSRFYLALHYQGSFAQAQRNLQQAISELEPAVAAYHIQPYQQLIEEPNMLVNYLSRVFIFCGMIAALLAASGIYALAANTVLQKTKEIGVRRALGASDWQIIRLFLREAGWQLLLGLSVGLALALGLIEIVSRSMLLDTTSLLLGVVLVPLAITLTVLAATLLPVRRAVEKEPAVALHQE